MEVRGEGQMKTGRECNNDRNRKIGRVDGRWMGLREEVVWNAGKMEG